MNEKLARVVLNLLVYIPLGFFAYGAINKSVAYGLLAGIGVLVLEAIVVVAIASDMKDDVSD